jgi:hypothetical protein
MQMRIQIVGYLGDDPQPGVVECELFDAAGKRHAFIEKVPMVSLENLTGSDKYPREGAVACEILARRLDANGQEIIRVTTAKPWDIESTEALAEFDLLPIQMIAILSII